MSMRSRRGFCEFTMYQILSACVEHIIVVVSFEIYSMLYVYKARVDNDCMQFNH